MSSDDAPNTVSTPPDLSIQQSIPPALNNNDDSPFDSDSEGSRDDTEDQDTRTQASTRYSCDTVATFTTNNLRLITSGQNSLIELRQV